MWKPDWSQGNISKLKKNLMSFLGQNFFMIEYTVLIRAGVQGANLKFKRAVKNIDNKLLQDKKDKVR
jgi:hypothetical protein